MVQHQIHHQRDPILAQHRGKVLQVIHGPQIWPDCPIVGHRVAAIIGVYLITPEADIAVAVDRLDTLLQRALSVVGGMVTDTDLATSVTMPSGAVCPAIKLIIQPPRN